MLRNYPQPCTCGGVAILDQRPINGPESLNFVLYKCNGCDRFTFATKTEECCRELWNASVDKSIEKLNIK